jgi:hypothetical protein
MMLGQLLLLPRQFTLVALAVESQRFQLQQVLEQPILFQLSRFLRQVQGSWGALPELFGAFSWR